MKTSLFLILLLPTTLFAQLPDSLLQKIINSTDHYSIQFDTLPITGTKTLPCLSVKINGKGPYRFLIDLGSNVLVFKQSVVEATNMDIVVKRTRGSIVKADKLEIGKSIFNNVHGGAYPDLDVDGVIGFNLLRKANFFLDYSQMLFAFHRDEPKENDPTYLKYDLIGRLPFLKSTIGNKTVHINFDTGADLWLYFPIAYKDSFSLKSPPAQFKEMSNNQTGTSMTYIAQLKDDVFFGNYTIASPEVILDPSIQFAYVGSSLLSPFKLSFYIRQQMVKMERAEKGNTINIPHLQTRK